MENRDKLLHSSHMPIIVMGSVYLLSTLFLFFSFGGSTSNKFKLISLALVMSSLTFRYLVVVDIYPSFLRIWKPFQREDILHEDISHVREIFPGWWSIVFKDSRHRVVFCGMNRIKINEILDKVVVTKYFP